LHSVWGMTPGLLPIEPYCGLPPLPAELAARWNLDPRLLAVLAAAALIYVAGMSKRGGRSASLGAPLVREQLAFAGGWFVAVVVFVSPLCALGVALFAAREVQHLLLMLVAAPLLRLGRPERVMHGFGLRRTPRSARSCDAVRAAGAWTCFAAAFCVWHIPSLYAATFASTVAYWSMHLSLLASAYVLWGALLDADAGTRLLGALAAALVMGLLGGLLSFAPAPLYAAHAVSTQAWGLSPLQDQQLAGLLCWIPSCAILLFSVLASAAALLREAPPRAWT